MSILRSQSLWSVIDLMDLYNLRGWFPSCIIPAYLGDSSFDINKIFIACKKKKKNAKTSLIKLVL